MMEFVAFMFVESMYKLHRWEVQYKSRGPIPDPYVIMAEVATFGSLECATYDMDGAQSKCQRIVNYITDPLRQIEPVTFEEISRQLAELRERLEDDFKKHLFLHLGTGAAAEMYKNPVKDWGVVLSRFSRVRHDIEECLRCFALDRFAAAVFHVMLIGEFGVIEAAKVFGAEGDRPGWGCLDRLQKINDKKWSEKSALEQRHADFLKNLLPFAFAMKNSWRHKMNHVDNKIEWIDTDFSPGMAKDIIDATRGFMERLAKDLPK